MTCRNCGRSLNSEVIASARSNGTPALSSVANSWVKYRTSRARLPRPNCGNCRFFSLDSPAETRSGVKPCRWSSRATARSLSPGSVPVRSLPSGVTARYVKVAAMACNGKDAAGGQKDRAPPAPDSYGAEVIRRTALSPPPSELLRHPHYLFHGRDSPGDFLPAVLAQVAHPVLAGRDRQLSGVGVPHDQAAQLFVHLHQLEDSHAPREACSHALGAARAAPGRNHSSFRRQGCARR